MNKVEKKEIKPEVREQVVNMLLLTKEVMLQHLQIGYIDDIAEDIAFEFLKAGYGKVEDYKKEIVRLKEENERLYNHKRHLEDQMIAYGWAEYVNDKVLTLKDSKQKAIKEFAEKLKHDLIVNNEENYKFFDYDYTLETIDDLLKKYGVDSTTKTVCPVCGQEKGEL